jgi:glycosyltransferase involved in cell wall biosynthesis
MNIGIDIKALHAGKAGIASYMRKTLNELQRIDTVNKYFLFEKRISSYKVENPLWKKVLLPSRLPGTLWLMFTVPRHLERYGINIFWGPEQIIPRVLPESRVAMVSTVHDVALKRCPKTMQVSNYFVNRILLGKSIKRSTSVLAVSGCVRDDIRTFYPSQAGNKIRVIYNGRPQRAYATAPPGDRGNHLFFAGSFEPRKNLLALLKALSILKSETDLRAPLRIAGPSGWKNSTLYSFIKSSGISDQISFLGYVTDSELAVEYRKCKAFIYPSSYEGFGLPVLEALEAGAPVLTSKGTAMEEIAGECCVLFNPADPRDIAAKIAALYNESIDIAALMEKSTNVLSRYAWENTAMQTLDELEKACRNR